MVLGWPPFKIVSGNPTSHQDGHQAKNRKKGGWNLKKKSPLKLLSQSQPNFAEMILGWSPSKNVSGISDLRPRWPPQPNLTQHRTLWEIHIKIFSSETTVPNATKLWWNDPWMAPFQNCVRWSQLPTKMAAKLKIEKNLIVHCCFSVSLWNFSFSRYIPIMQIRKKGGWNLKKNLLLWNYWANLNQTLLKWSSGGPLPKMCPAFQTSDQDGRYSRT